MEIRSRLPVHVIEIRRGNFLSLKIVESSLKITWIRQDGDASRAAYDASFEIRVPRSFDITSRVQVYLWEKVH